MQHSSKASSHLLVSLCGDETLYITIPCLVDALRTLVANTYHLEVRVGQNSFPAPEHNWGCDVAHAKAVRN